MERTEKISTSVTKDEKSCFRVLAAERDMSMAELLRELVYDEIEKDDSEGDDSPEEDRCTEATTVD